KQGREEEWQQHGNTALGNLKDEDWLASLNGVPKHGARGDGIEMMKSVEHRARTREIDRHRSRIDRFGTEANVRGVERDVTSHSVEIRESVRQSPLDRESICG